MLYSNLIIMSVKKPSDFFANSYKLRISVLLIILTVLRVLDFFINLYTDIGLTGNSILIEFSKSVIPFVIFRIVIIYFEAIIISKWFNAFIDLFDYLRVMLTYTIVFIGFTLLVGIIEIDFIVSWILLLFFILQVVFRVLYLSYHGVFSEELGLRKMLIPAILVIICIIGYWYMLIGVNSHNQIRDEVYSECITVITLSEEIIDGEIKISKDEYYGIRNELYGRMSSGQSKSLYGIRMLNGLEYEFEERVQELIDQAYIYNNEKTKESLEEYYILKDDIDNMIESYYRGSS